MMVIEQFYNNCLTVTKTNTKIIEDRSPLYSNNCWVKLKYKIYLRSIVNDPKRCKLWRFRALEKMMIRMIIRLKLFISRNHRFSIAPLIFIGIIFIEKRNRISYGYVHCRKKYIHRKKTHSHKKSRLCKCERNVLLTNNTRYYRIVKSYVSLCLNRFRVFIYCTNSRYYNIITILKYPWYCRMLNMCINMETKK